MSSNPHFFLALAVAAFVGSLPCSGCRHVEYVDAGTDSNTEPDLEGVDLLIVIDDSLSMSEEQAILATDLFAFVGSLVSPLPTWDHAAIDDLRIAVVTSNMGLSSDGENNDEFWPGTVPPECQGFGDDGEFQHISALTIDIANDFVQCDESAAEWQCPPASGWSCENLDADGVGVCHTSGTTTNACPMQSTAWLETTPASPDDNLALRIACLAKQGTGGCGFEQQIASAATALSRTDQSDFVREGALLTVLVVSDEEDCSMQDGAALLGEEEIQNLDDKKVNIACRHTEHLFPAAHFHDALTALKTEGAVFFAAIVGVPYGGQPGAAACQGLGDALGDCLGQDAMQLVAVPPVPPEVDWFFRPACTRDEGAVEVTSATPGGRYVELAGSFGSMGYVYSVCNADWSPAFEAIGESIAGALQ